MSRTADSVRNKKKYNYIMDHYITADQPMSQEDIAKHFGCTVGSIKNFMYRHKLNKKHYYKTRNEKIKSMYYIGATVPELAKLYNVTTQNIYTILDR